MKYNMITYETRHALNFKLPYVGSYRVRRNIDVGRRGARDRSKNILKEKTSVSSRQPSKIGKR